MVITLFCFEFAYFYASILFGYSPDTQKERQHFHGATPSIPANENKMLVISVHSHLTLNSLCCEDFVAF